MSPRALRAVIGGSLILAATLLAGLTPALDGRLSGRTMAGGVGCLLGGAVGVYTVVTRWSSPEAWALSRADNLRLVRGLPVTTVAVVLTGVALLSWEADAVSAHWEAAAAVLTGAMIVAWVLAVATAFTGRPRGLVMAAVREYESEDEVATTT